MKVNPKGFRKETEQYLKKFVLAQATSEKQISPFIVITEKEVKIVHTVDELLNYPNETEVLQTWPGKKRSDVFYSKVEMVRKEHEKA